VQDDLSPEMQAITRMMGALQAMQQLRWPAALGGGGGAHADAERGAGDEAGKAGADDERGRDSGGASGAGGRGQGGASGEEPRRGGGGGGQPEQAAAREPAEPAGAEGGGESGRARGHADKGDDDKGDKDRDKQGGGAHGHAGKGDEERDDKDVEKEVKDETSAEAYEPCVPGRVVFIERRAPCRARGCQLFQHSAPADHLALTGVAGTSCLPVVPLHADVCQSMTSQ